MSYTILHLNTLPHSFSLFWGGYKHESSSTNECIPSQRPQELVLYARG